MISDLLCFGAVTVVGDARLSDDEEEGVEDAGFSHRLGCRIIDMQKRNKT